MPATVREAIEDAHHGKKQMVKCPTHADGTESLHIGPGTQPNEEGVVQPVVMHCHAGCEVPDILRAEGIEWDEVMAPRDTTVAPEHEWTPAGDASNVYDYVDEEGTLLFQALRVTTPGGGKTFFQRQPDASRKSGWTWNITGVRRVLYRLPQVIEAVKAGRIIYIAEGEKDVETLRHDGLVGTCNPMGAGKWQEEFAEVLRGAHVVIIADADDPGREHARYVAETLLAVEATVEVVETPIPKAKDYTGHRGHGGTVDTLITTFTSVPKEVDGSGISIKSMIETEWDTGAEIIPGYVARSNVVLLTGFEGHGKSLLFRQMAVCCASGINPFTFMQMPPLTALYIDAENPEHQQVMDWRKLALLARRHTGQEIDPNRLTIFSEWQTEPDLLSTPGQAWLFERIQAYKPDVVFMGPVQNLVSRDVKDDEVVRKLKHAVNTARSMCGTAFFLEHHAPHRMNGDQERSTRPYGSSLFQKWPDFGYGLQPERDTEGVYKLAKNRRPRVRSRDWPSLLRWGKPGTLEWPWMFEEDVRGSTIDKEATKGLRLAVTNS